MNRRIGCHKCKRHSKPHLILLKYFQIKNGISNHLLSASCKLGESDVCGTNINVKWQEEIYAVNKVQKSKSGKCEKLCAKVFIESTILIGYLMQEA